MLGQDFFPLGLLTFLFRPLRRSKLLRAAKVEQISSVLVLFEQSHQHVADVAHAEVAAPLQFLKDASANVYR